MQYDVSNNAAASFNTRQIGKRTKDTLGGLKNDNYMDKQHQPTS